MHGREESMDGTCDAYGCMHVDVKGMAMCAWHVNKDMGVMGT